MPLGVLLSGGIDSSAVLAAIREVTGRPIKTFTVGFPDQSYDESASARLTARHFGAEHHELIAQPDDSRIVAHYIRHFDEPYGESSAIPIYYVAGMAAREITVAIGGDGGDELMGGYNHHFASLLMARYNRLPAPLSRRLIPWVVNALPVSHSRASFEHLAKRFVSAADASPEQAQPDRVRKLGRVVSRARNSARRSPGDPLQKQGRSLRARGGFVLLGTGLFRVHGAEGDGKA